MKETAGIIYLIGMIAISSGVEGIYGKAISYLVMGAGCLILAGIILFIYIAEQGPAETCDCDCECDECREEEQHEQQ